MRICEYSNVVRITVNHLRRRCAYNKNATDHYDLAVGERGSVGGDSLRTLAVQYDHIRIASRCKSAEI